MSGSVVSAALGIFGYNLASSLFGKLARGKKFFIQYCKYFKPHGIKLNGRDLKISYLSQGQEEDYIRFKMQIDDMFKEVTNSKLEGEALNNASIDFRNCMFPFYVYYNFKLKTDFYNIAVKNGINLSNEKQENFIDFNGKVVVKPNNGKLSVCLENTIIHKEKKWSDEGCAKTKDVTDKFNIADPKTQEEKNKKIFMTYLLNILITTIFLKQILINN
ncbi:MAG: hypothetical protein IJU86_01270 [Firmicutes bacterium]|nr:hypothetical protein [Bacillota bacterium]